MDIPSGSLFVADRLTSGSAVRASVTVILRHPCEDPESVLGVAKPPNTDSWRSPHPSGAGRSSSSGWSTGHRSSKIRTTCTDPDPRGRRGPCR